MARRRYNESVKIVMMKPSIASRSGASVVLRAAIGDITALKTVMRDSTNRAALHCAALLLLDDEPDPRAALHLLSALGDAAPAALARCVMNAPEVWDDARINISARRAATIIKGLHATWLPRMPTNVRAHLVTASAATANTSVIAAYAWDALFPGERASLIRAVINEPSVVRRARCAADMLSVIGATGARHPPPEHMNALVSAAAQYCGTAAQAARAAWDALHESERCVLAHAAAKNARSSGALLAGIGVEGWRSLPPDIRASLVRAAARSPRSAAQAAGTLWDALDSDNRARLMRVIPLHALIAGNADAIPVAMDALTPAFWRDLAPELRMKIIETVTTHEQVACNISDALWNALADHERNCVIQAGGRNGRIGAHVMNLIGRPDWGGLAPSLRSQIIDVTGCAAYAAIAAASMWDALNRYERERLAFGAAQWEWSAAAFIAAVGADGWMSLFPSLRAMLLNAVMCSPDADIRATLVVLETLNADERLRMRRALLAPCPVQHVVQALQHGASWRRWMHEFLYDDHATNEEWMAWRSAAASGLLPPDITQRAGACGVSSSPRRLRR